jgi:DNA (cytosine-5)-methyltransferase 1
MAIRSYNVIELCAGVHGLGLGINIAEPRARSIAHVEREASAAATLVARMEAGELAPAPIWSDVTTFDARGWSGRVHCVASGDPCQPNSVAGNRLGSDDDRFLIEHVVRIYGESGADRLFRENVTENADGQLAALVPPLEAMGCRIAAGIFSAAEVGASHRRERLFIMADRKGGGCRIVGDAARSRGRGHPDGGDAAMANTDGAGFHVGGEPLARVEQCTCGDQPDRCDCAGRTLGNPEGDQRRSKQQAGRSGSGRAGPSRASNQLGIDDVANAESARPQGRGADDGTRGRTDAAGPAGLCGGTMEIIFAPGPADRRWPSILSAAPGLEPAICRMADGLAHRVDRLRACGNGVVSLAAAYAWVSLGALLETSRSAE